jgi:O-antigen ligase
MIESEAHQPVKRVHFVLLVIFCLLLPNIHFTALVSQVVLPREFFLYLYSTLFILFLTQRDKLGYNTFFIVASGFLAWQGFALSWSSDLSTGIEDTLNAFVFLFSAFVLFQIRDHGTRVTLLNTLIFSLSLAALIGVLQNFDWNPFDLHQSAIPSSTFNNKNLAASASLLFLPFIFFQLFVSHGLSQKLLYSLAATATLSFILVSHSKGVWLAGVCLLLITLITYLSRRKEDRQDIRQLFMANRIYLAVIVLFSLAIFVTPGARNQGEIELENYTLAAKSGMLRMGFYKDAVPLIAEHPIVGVGTGGLRREFRAQPGGDYARQHAEENLYLNRLHNDHLQYLVEQGLIGLALWLALLITLFKTAIGYVKNSDNALNDKLAVYSLLLGISGMLLHAMVSFPIRSVSTGSLFWLSIGLMLSYQNDREEIESHAIPAKVKYPLVSTLLVISVFAIYNVTHRIIGSYYTKQASEILAPGYCFATKFYLNNLLETTHLELQSAQLLAITYDYCGGESPEKTMAEMDSILAFEPNHSLALLVKADSAYQLGEHDMAYSLYLHAQQVNPQELRAYLGLAKISTDNNRPAEAIKWIMQALDIDSENVKANEMLKALQKP